MLDEAAVVVAPGGVLVYAVCSLAPQEGPAIIDAFLADNPDFEIDRTPSLALRIGDVVDSDGFVTTRPDVGGLDGFFAARLRRRN
jgi:16S rRNA (cytosine967-C5)-methyltransferase